MNRGIFRAGEKPRRGSRLKRLLGVLLVFVVLLAAAVGVIWRFYYINLQPVSTDPNAQAQTVIVESGSSPKAIANQLHESGLIRSAWTFERYVQSKNVSSELQAGTYSLSPTQSTPDIVSQLTHGKVTTELVTILPGQRIDQIRQSFINDGFSEADVDKALDPATYADHPVLVDKPVGNSLEGYLYPDSFQRTFETKPWTIVEESLNQMQKHLTPDVRAAFAANGLSTYQGIILASIVEQEVSKPADRAQAAQVFIKRIQVGMPLGSDVTAIYGAINAGQTQLTQAQKLAYDTPYNTLIHTGFPPTPISNVSNSSLQAVAHPANTDWLYFVAGDDGTTYFSKTIEEHEALAEKYCHKLCGR